MFLLVSGFVVVVAWILFSIYHKAATSTIPPAVNIQIKPIAPEFDTKTINELKRRTLVSPLYEFQESKKVASPSVTPKRER